MPLREDDPIVKLEDVTCKKATERAMLIVMPDDTEHWIPMSHVHPDSEVYDDDANAGPGRLVISEWIATQKGLV